MRKILILSLLFSQTIDSAARPEKYHPQQLISQYPYALLTDDYGVLTEDDLKTNSCDATPCPFSEKDTSSPYPYWQCFDLRTANLACEGRKYDFSEKVRVTLLVISGIRDGVLHEYLARRPIPLSSCRLYQKAWRKFVENEKYLCISGEISSIKTDSNGRRRWVWVFDRYKTKKGCDSYFEGECDLKKIIANGQCEN